MIDIDKFVASLIKHYCEAYGIDRTSIRCWFDDALEEQGLEYKNGEIVKTQRRIAAEAKEAIFDNEDEKIRKLICSSIKEGMPIISPKNKELAIAWLEKQCTPAQLNEEEQNRFAKGVLISCAMSFINYLDAHKYDGKMCVCLMENVRI